MNHAAAPGASIARPRSLRKQLYALHAWVGFHLAAIMVLVLATGTIATLSNEIDWLLQHDMRVSPDGDRVGLDVMADAVRAHRPDDLLVSLARIGGDHFAWRARMEDPHGQQTFVHVDPWTGNVTGETHPLTVQRFFRDLHRYLFLPNFIGIHVVGALAFVLAISLYTGLKTTRNWRTLLLRIRTDRGARVFWGDAHKAAGLWVSWFFVVVIATGVWYLAEFDAGIAGQRFQPPGVSLPVDRVDALGPIIHDADTAAVLDAVARIDPAFEPMSILYPTRARAPLTVTGRGSQPLLRDRANRIFLDPVSLQVLKVQRETDISWIAYLNEMADPLHFGTFGGLATKLLWFVCGVAMTGLSVTGVWLTWQRLRSRAPSLAQYATLPVLAVSAVCFFGWLDYYVVPHKPAATQVLARAALPQGVRAELRLAVSEPTGTPSGPIEILARAADPGTRLALIRARVTAGDTTLTVPAQKTGPVTSLRLDLPAEQLRPGQPVQAVLDFASDAQLVLEGRVGGG